MREDRRKRYDDGFRREALGLIKAGVGYVSLARRLAMPAYTAKQWTMLYRSGGEESFMGVQGSRRYDWETKAAAVRDHVDNGLTVPRSWPNTMWRASRRCDAGAASGLATMY